jgi:hypothetical protein
LEVLLLLVIKEDRNFMNGLAADEFTRAPVILHCGNSFQSERPIDPISDIPITKVNTMMFGAR